MNPVPFVNLSNLYRMSHLISKFFDTILVNVKVKEKGFELGLQPYDVLEEADALDDGSTLAGQRLGLRRRAKAVHQLSA